METSLNTAHGSAHGNSIARQDCLTFWHGAAPGSHEQRARLFAQYGVQLADMAHPLGSHLWQDLSQVCAWVAWCMAYCHTVLYSGCCLASCCA